MAFEKSRAAVMIDGSCNICCEAYIATCMGDLSSYLYSTSIVKKTRATKDQGYYRFKSSKVVPPQRWKSTFLSAAV